MTTRKYLASDREACIALFNSNCPKYFDPEEISGLENWLNGQDTGQITYKTSEADYFYVTELNEKVVACGGFYIVKNQPRANMVWGMVDKLNHGQGIGKQLFQFRVEQITARYPKHAIVLDTSQHTVGFFEKLGFSVSKITPDGYGPGLDR